VQWFAMKNLQLIFNDDAAPDEFDTGLLTGRKSGEGSGPYFFL
jgi:hypothetical protein